jgi:putative ABC transport system permease protein
MLGHYLKLAIRNMARHKGFSLINLSGLTLGLTACLLIGLFVWDEKQYDKFVPGHQNIYRVYQKTEGEDNKIIATAPPVFSTALTQNFPEVEQALRVITIKSKELVEVNGKKFYEEGGFVADSNFFHLFPLRFFQGSPVNALDEPNSIVISKDMASRYFGHENPVGKDMRFRSSLWRIKGVLENHEKFHLPINYLIPLKGVNFPPDMMQSWQWYPFQTYVQLKEKTDAHLLEAKFQRYSKPFLKGEGGSNVPFFQPLDQIHLHSSDFQSDISTRGNITYVNALTIVAVFILLIACFNFINLATSRSMQRAKEVGVRKTIGAGTKQLIGQFISETILYAVISMALALALTASLLPALNSFTEKQIIFDVFTNPVSALLIIALTLVAGLLAGFYPALVLSRFQPVKVLKGSIMSASSSGRTPWLRHGLVVIQFSLSILLIISAIVVIRQVNYLHNKDLGFQKEQILFFPMRGKNLQKNYASFKTELQKSAGVTAVSVGYGFPGDMFGDGPMTVKEKPELKPAKATQLMVDEDYIKTLGLSLLAGRDFSKDIPSDASAYIINETAVREFGLETPQNALGKTLSWPTWRKPDSLKTGPIIGVVKDFHYKSLHEVVEPAVMHIYPQAYSKVAVKLSGKGIESEIKSITKLWNKFSPDYPIEYNFLDESFEKMYKGEDKLKTLLSLFTAVTIFIACLGLLGLAAYAAERRRKELGIRKVLGASVEGLVVLLSKDFLLLVLLSLIVASPVAWYFMNKWLETFFYRIDISWWIFAVAALLALALATLSVSFQALKAALSNPVKNLRIE